MSYRDFSWAMAKEAFGLSAIEGVRFIPTDLDPVAPSEFLAESLRRGIPWAIAIGNEKARSEAIIYPILLEVRHLLGGQVSLFSGETFDVEPEVGLNGVCDFILSRSPEQLEIEAPAIVVVEAKREDLKPGMGQCLAAMVAAGRFNRSPASVYGIVTTGTAWRFLRLVDLTVTVDLTCRQWSRCWPCCSGW